MGTQFMVKKKTEVPPELLSKEFLKQFKTEEDVSKFFKDLHSQVLEQMLQGEMDAHLGYEKHDVAGNNTGNSRNGSFPKTIQTEHGESTIQIPRDRNSEFEPVIVPKHQSRGLSIEKLVISLYAKGILVSKRTEYKIRRYKTLNLYSNGKEETQISQLQDKCRNGAVTRRIN
ncbi:MAG: transposase [Bacteroidales bacterium]|nr:transposase [Bacteroidales bacterium]MDD2832192.1 transposase [Bacteroidales bacterium]MDD5046971.1 transposase [Bacteroidales bacterium]MDD5517524.1 transposase [Bacteroidales bacterium]